jgi:hypothetical protein
MRHQGGAKCPEMGLGSFGISGCGAPVQVRREGRELGKRLNIWEKMAVIERGGGNGFDVAAQSLGGFSLFLGGRWRHSVEAGLQREERELRIGPPGAPGKPLLSFKPLLSCKPLLSYCLSRDLGIPRRGFGNVG